MARNKQKREENVKTHPSIIDIPIRCQETAINFVKTKTEMPKQQNQKNKAKRGKEEQNQESGDENESNQQVHQNNAEAADVKKGDKDKAPKKYPNLLRCSAKYNFDETTVVLCFWDEDFPWSLVSITGCHVHNDIRIGQNGFAEITGKDFKYNITPVATEAKVFKLNIGKIDRHILMTEFAVHLVFMYLEDVNMQYFGPKYIFDVPFFRQETRLQFKPLGYYHADKRITSLYNNKFKLSDALTMDEKNLLMEIDKYQRTKLSERNAGNTTQMIKYALNIEDLSSQDELKDFTLQNVKLRGLMNNYLFAATRKQLPPNFEEMSLCLVPMGKYCDDKINYEDDCIFTQVERFDHNQVHFEKKFPPVRGVTKMVDLTTTYFVRFIPNRITYRACFQALDSIKQHLLHCFFDDFEHEPEYCKRDNGRLVDNFEWYNEQIKTNEEQMTAIKNIVNCTAYPFPYVVFGPPGTGKTSCIVECIAQILKLKPDSRIMVTAQSNSACDEVGVRLLKYISSNKIFRFYSASLLNPENGETSDILRKTSNLRNKRNQYPTREEFRHFNVILVTLMSCSRMVQLDGEAMNRNFDYIFVDECAAATEPEAFVPIIGLGTDFQEITTNIVLLGDHKQLGPVISSKIADRLGLGVSLMERIMSKRRYQKSLHDKSYDKNYVTQLLDNFRSHPAILQFSNVLFYDSELRAKLAEPELSFGTKYMYLTNKKFPVVFHCCKEKSQRVLGGTSSYNEGEIKLVRFYVDSLLKLGIGGRDVKPEDIGVVSPYKAQLYMLRDELQHAGGVEIGTAEYYQGREKKIIIISTVKSRDNVGFLKNEKRLNVCITRAKCLLILVGNADTLQQDSLWNSFMHFCQANDACCGEKFKLTDLTEEEQKVLDELNSVFDQRAVDGKSVDLQRAIDKDEALKAIEERMKNINLLRQRK